MGTSPTASGQVPSGTPRPVEPVGDTVNTRKVPFTGAEPAAGGKEVRLEWWSGVEPCTVLDRVAVAETAERVTITLYEGTPPAARDVNCVMIAVAKTYTVKLQRPVGAREIVDGARS